MAIILRYQCGSSGQWETHRSLPDALKRAAVLLKGAGHTSLQIAENGKIIMSGAEIIAKVPREQ